MGTGGKVKMATGLEDSRVVNRAPISLGNFHMSSLWMLSINFHLLPKMKLFFALLQVHRKKSICSKRLLSQGFPSADEGKGSHCTFSLGIYLKSLHKSCSFSEAFLFRSRHRALSVVHRLALSVLLLCKQAFILKLSRP